MRVLITGAGVAGLACAVALRRAGIEEVVLVERATEVAAHGGTGIAIPPNGARALARVGVALDRLIEGGSRLREYRFHDASGRLLTVADLTRLWLSEREPYFAVHRRRLYDALLEALGDQRIEFETTAEIELAQHDNGRPLTARIARDGRAREEQFDLVIGADGIHSALRGALWPSAAARDLEWWSWRCVTECPDLVRDAQLVYSGLGGVFLYIPIGGEQVYVYAACRRPTGTAAAPNAGHGREIAARFGGFGVAPALIERLAALGDDAFHTSPLEEVPHEQLGSAGRGRVLLVGDALHACSPNMAQGVSLAAEDAAVLAELLGSDGDSVVERFWERRLPRIRHVQQLTRKRDHLVNKRADSALFQRLSNLVIRLRGGDRLQRDAFAYLLKNQP